MELFFENIFFDLVLNSDPQGIHTKLWLSITGIHFNGLLLGGTLSTKPKGSWELLVLFRDSEWA